MDIPPDAVLSGLLLLVSFSLAHSTVSVPGTMWIEPVFLWIAIGMQTGSGKTPLYTYLMNLLDEVHKKVHFAQAQHSWLLDHSSFEKMGELMSTNHSKILGFYDELSTFLEQMNVFRGKGLAESHELSTFLFLYNGKGWSPLTGLC